MEYSCAYNWRPIESLPLFAANIDVLLEETRQQHQTFMKIQEKSYYLNATHISHIIKYYTSLTSTIMLYEAQLQKWRDNEAMNREQNSVIDLLLEKIITINKHAKSIINFAMHFQNPVNNPHSVTADPRLVDAEITSETIPYAKN